MLALCLGSSSAGEKPYKSAAQDYVRMPGKPPLAAGKIFIPQRACRGFCDAFNMRSLSANDDSQKSQSGGEPAEDTGWRESRQEQQRSETKKTVQLFESVSFE